MNDSVEQRKTISEAENIRIRPPDEEGSLRPALNFKSLDIGIDRLDRAISFLRSWSGCPHQFDHINCADRENLFLTVLELAESSRRHIAQLETR